MWPSAEEENPVVVLTLIVLVILIALLVWLALGGT